MSRRHESVRDTGASTASQGGIANSGRIDQLTVLTAAETKVSSAYLERVRSIAPPRLLGREEEYAELAAFCTAIDPAPSYRWWRAPAWAGKSALMSWFVLHPPAGVRILSFFVTARYAGQNDRVAFAEVLIEQLAELLDESLPPLLTESTREAHLARMLSRAARQCRDDAQRLVLIVDGLDEDRGVTADPDTYSIAALLPADPPSGLRVVVASRPNPPIPADVQETHPLHDPAVVRVLTRSPHAEVVRQDAQRELKRLLAESVDEQNLLGLLAAAGGGLSADDLAELAGAERWEVDERLALVSARTFTPQAGLWRSEVTTFSLAHEELQQQAVRRLGAVRLAGYRERLHAWAEKYQRRGWPSGTPEYLLRGYFSLLQETGDRTRMLSLATDLNRHDRMLDMVGGDYAALAEITAAATAFAAASLVDFAALGRLTVHRHILGRRAGRVPVSLPAAWARLGQIDRAEILAGFLHDPEEQSRAISEIAAVCARQGQPERAERLLSGLTDPRHRAWASAHLLGAVGAGGLPVRTERQDTLPGVALLLAAGDLDEAERAAAAVADPEHRMAAFAGITTVAASSGDSERAWRAARTALSCADAVASPIRRADRTSDLARATASLGGPESRRIAERAHDYASQISEPDYRVIALADAAWAASAVGDRDRSTRLFDAAVTALPRIGDTYLRGRAYARIVLAMGRAGVQDRARSLLGEATTSIDRIVEPGQGTRGWIALVRAAVVLGDGDPVRVLADRAASTAETIADSDHQIWSLLDLANALEPFDRLRATALLERVETLARGRPDVEDQALLLARVGRAVARHDREYASELVQKAEKLARTLHQGSLRLQVAKAAAANGDLELAERIARSITESSLQAEAWADIARAMAAAAGQDTNPDRARELAQRAEALLADRDDHDGQGRALARLAEAMVSVDAGRARALAAHAESLIGLRGARELHGETPAAVARALAAVGRVDRAEKIATTLTTHEHQARVLADTAIVLATSDPERATGLAERAEKLCETMVRSYLWSETLMVTAQAMIAVGAAQRAYALAGRIADSYERAKVYAAVAALGVPANAEGVLAQVLAGSDWTAGLEAVAEVCPAAVIAIGGELVRVIDHTYGPAGA